MKPASTIWTRFKHVKHFQKRGPIHNRWNLLQLLEGCKQLNYSHVWNTFQICQATSKCVKPAPISWINVRHLKHGSHIGTTFQMFAKGFNIFETFFKQTNTILKLLQHVLTYLRLASISWSNCLNCFKVLFQTSKYLLKHISNMSSTSQLFGASFNTWSMYNYMKHFWIM